MKRSTDYKWSIEQYRFGIKFYPLNKSEGEFISFRITYKMAVRKLYVTGKVIPGYRKVENHYSSKQV